MNGAVCIGPDLDTVPVIECEPDCVMEVLEKGVGSEEPVVVGEEMADFVSDGDCELDVESETLSEPEYEKELVTDGDCEFDVESDALLEPEYEKELVPVPLPV
jgi:hypothetical protein